MKKTYLVGPDKLYKQSCTCNCTHHSILSVCNYAFITLTAIDLKHVFTPNVSIPLLVDNGSQECVIVSNGWGTWWAHIPC